MRGCLHTAGGGPSLRLLPRKGNELVAKKAKLTRKVHPPLLPLRRDWLPRWVAVPSADRHRPCSGWDGRDPRTRARGGARRGIRDPKGPVSRERLVVEFFLLPRCPCNLVVLQLALAGRRISSGGEAPRGGAWRPGWSPVLLSAVPTASLSEERGCGVSLLVGRRPGSVAAVCCPPRWRPAQTVAAARAGVLLRGCCWWRARHRRTPSESAAPRSAGGGPVARW